MTSPDKAPDDNLHRPMPAGHPTPYVEIDSARLERNLRAMQAKADAAGVALRPHIKTHKSVAVARRQVELGAAGLTASKPGEAEVFLDAGFGDILLAYPVVRPDAVDGMLARAAASKASVSFLADSLTGVEALAAAGERHGMVLPVHLKVDVGLGRVGVRPDDPLAVVLAASIGASASLSFAGLVSHAGHAYGAASPAAIAAIAREEAEGLSGLRERLGEAGHAVERISTGATPTALGAPLWGGSAEVRPGNYALLDLTALRLGIATGDDLALSVIARVVSVNERHAILDAGSKTLSSDQGPHGMGGGGFGLAVICEGADGGGAGKPMPVERLSEEHAFARHDGAAPAIGALVRIFPKHSCAVVALADACLYRGAGGQEEWRAIEARGKVN